MLKSKVGWSFWESSLIIFTMPMAVGPFRAATVAVPRSEVSTSEASLTPEATLLSELSPEEEALSRLEAAPSTEEDTLLSEVEELSEAAEELPAPLVLQPNKARHRARASVKDKIRFITESGPFY